MRPVIIIGAGIAGMSAALTLAEQGQKSILVSALPSERAQSVMAAGGINAALNTKGEGDTIQQHYGDTLHAGCDLADPNAVRNLVEGAPEVVRRLAALGVAFNRQSSGALDLRHFGGQKKQRTAFAQSSTGKQIVSALIQSLRRWEATGLVERRPHHTLHHLAQNEEKECTGCIIKDNYTNSFEFLAGNVLLASGGLNGLFGKTTGTIQNKGAATALAYRAGAACANLEMIQYHPTTTAIAGKRALISEAARGEGGRLFVRRGTEKWYFMEEKFPELGNLMPRDVVSRESVLACEETGAETVWLDMTALSAETFEKKLSDLRDFCLEFLHLDPKREYIPVYPGIHYFMGGLYVDADHKTTLGGLYAAGECACQYHGANRLGGNSLLGAAYGGMRAAQTLLREGQDRTFDEAAVWRAFEAARTEDGCEKQISCKALEQELIKTMKKTMGIRRTEESLAVGAAALQRFKEELLQGRDPSVPCEEQRALLESVCLSEAMVESARARRESRGAQWRSDYPARDDGAYQKTTVARFENGRAAITFEAIPKEGDLC